MVKKLSKRTEPQSITQKYELMQGGSHQSETFYFRLVVDANKAHDAPVCHPYENPSYPVVAKPVKNAMLEYPHCDGLRFKPLFLEED